MATNIRPEISTKNQYWIERHRYYELKHFCLQYPLWKKAYSALPIISGYSPHEKTNNGNKSDPTVKCAMSRVFYADRMQMIERVAAETDDVLASCIRKGVTEGLSYDSLKTRFGIPCCRDTYYELYRRFFWILNRVRQ